jgi:hypothetical protein
MNANNANIDNNWLPHYDLIRGFFDADGSFQVKIYHGKIKRVSFAVNIIFGQQSANTEFLQQIINSLTSQIDINQIKFLPKMSNREITNLSGTLSYGTSFSIAFSNPLGQKMLEIWRENPPNSPSKLLDYRIAYLLFQIKKIDALTLVNQNISDIDPCEDLFIAELALLWVRFQMYAAKNAKKNRILLDEHYQQLNATEIQIEQSRQFGQNIIKNILEEQNNIINNPTILIPKITREYLAGYYIGDGSFMMVSKINTNNSINFSISFSFSLTDCKENVPLLYAIKEKLKRENNILVNIFSYNDSNYYKAVISRREDCQCLVEYWRNQTFPKFRKNQYDCFAEAITIYTSGKYYEDLRKAEKLIELKWSMAPNSRQKKGSLNGDLINVRIWFNKKK